MAVLILAGCAETTPVPGTRDSPPPRPGVKVGKPYSINGVVYTPRIDDDYDEVGLASWYGPRFHGKPTANGERYDMNDLTAAHTTLPLPTTVQVTNLENGRSLNLRINDRGPFVEGRIIDVSRRAAELLGFHQNGTARVRVKVVPETGLELASRDPGRRTPERPVPVPARSGPPARPPADRGSVYVQAGAFTIYQNAMDVSGRLRDLGPVQVSPVQAAIGEIYRVRLGPVGSIDEAERLRLAASDAGYPGSKVVID